MPFATVNWIAVFVVAVINMIIGASWYAQGLFGKPWMKLVGLSKKDLNAAKKKGMGKSYFAMFMGALIMAFVLAQVIGFAAIQSIASGAFLGFFMWLGFIATTGMATVIFAHKPIKLYLLDNGYWFVSLIIMGAILAVWR
ncbi:MAG: DUF1761 domain-containing protein [Nanoarchaeota archaeon]